MPEARAVADCLTQLVATGDASALTGKRVTVRGADVCTVEDGLVTERHIYYDQVELLGQLGLLPE